MVGAYRIERWGDTGGLEGPLSWWFYFREQSHLSSSSLLWWYHTAVHLKHLNMPLNTDLKGVFRYATELKMYATLPLVVINQVYDTTAIWPPYRFFIIKSYSWNHGYIFPTIIRHCFKIHIFNSVIDFIGNISEPLCFSFWIFTVV